ncbi:MAG: class I SAM-dependent methyltransferase [Thermoplasmata archaeon]
MAESGPPSRRAPDGSPYPDRNGPNFERDVRRMFGHIAERYDWFDHVASLGNDFLWRPRALGQLDRFRTAGPMRRVLDVGCGTGDLARLVARRYPGSRVIGADFTAPMLANARRRGRRAAEGPRVSLARATALRLPFADGAFDLVTNAFVARNCSTPTLTGSSRGWVPPSPPRVRTGTSRSPSAPCRPVPPSWRFSARPVSAGSSPDRSRSGS